MPRAESIRTRPSRALVAGSFLALALCLPATARTDGTIVVTPERLARATACLDFHATLAAEGGRAPYSFAVTSGVLPAGLTLSADGVISGVPTAPSGSEFTVTATDADGCTGELVTALGVARGFRPTDEEVNLAIPSVGTGGSGDPGQDSTVSVLTVSDVPAAIASSDLTVHVSLLHDRTSDLVLTLITPDAVRVELSNRLGENGRHYLGTAFSDSAPAPVCTAAPPFTGTYRPEQPIGPHGTNGTWQLEIRDAVAGMTGVLLDWSLEFDFVTIEPARRNQANGWSISLPEPASEDQGITVTDEWFYVSAGSSVHRYPKSLPWLGGAWTKTIPSVSMTRPLVVKRAALGPIVVATASNGYVYGLDEDDGTIQWARDTRRVSCTADTLTAPAVAQSFDESDCEFRAAYPNTDLVIVGTHYLCSTTTSNKIFGLRASDSAIQWTFNAAGTNQVDAIYGLAVDASRNRVVATSAKSDPARSQNTVWAVSTIDGSRTWARDADDIRAQPVIAEDGIYVLSTSGVFRKLDAETGSVIWSLSIGPGPYSFRGDFAFDPRRDMLLASDIIGNVYGVRDEGAAASLVWSTSAPAPRFGSLTVAPISGKFYAGEGFWNRVYQGDILTGTLDGSYYTVGQQTSHFIVDSTVGGAKPENRLMILAGNRVERAEISWTSGLFFFEQNRPFARSEDPLTRDAAILGAASPAQPVVGQLVTDRLDVRSDGGLRSPGCIDVAGEIPAGATLISHSLSQGTFSTDGNRWTARLGDVPSFAPAWVTLTWRPDLAGEFVRTATVTTEWTDSFPANDSVTLSTTAVTPDEADCGAGSVNANAGPPADVLTVNGSAGDAGRIVTMLTRTPIDIALDAAPAGPGGPGEPLGRYALWLWLGDPANPQAIVVQGETLGCTVSPTPLNRPATPQPFRCLKGTGMPPALCGRAATLPSPARAPWSVTRSQGMKSPLTFTLQGLLEDASAAGTIPFAVTNAVTVRIE